MDWCYIYRINDNKSRRHGATEYQRRMRDDGRAGRWCCMAVSIADLVTVFTSINTVDMGWRNMAEASSGACTEGVISGVDRRDGDGCGRGIRHR